MIPPLASLTAAALAVGLMSLRPAHAADQGDPLAAYEAVGHSVVTDLHLPALGWTDAQFEAFISGLRAGFRGQRLHVDAATQAQLQAIGQRIGEAQARAKTSGATADAPPDFVAQARRQFQLQDAASGMLFRILRHGAGPRPTIENAVVISFEAASADRGAKIPQLTTTRARVKVSDLMPGLAEGVRMLALDGAGLFLLPPVLSFASGDWPEGVPPGTPLLFSLELHEIEPAGAAP